MSARLPCGCKSDDGRWLELCPVHRIETDALHERAQREYRAAQERAQTDKPEVQS